MNRAWRIALLIITPILVISVTAWAILAPREARIPQTYVQVGRAPVLSLDYVDCVIPPNIAPLNVVIREDGSRYCVQVHGPRGNPIVVGADDGEINIPLKPWRALLEANRGEKVGLDVYVRQEGHWRRFETVTNTVATDPMDPYVVYRLLAGPNQESWPIMGIQERHVESFESRWLLPYSRDRCVNCHTFINNDPSRMMFHLRGQEGKAMLFARRDGDVEKINTVTQFNPFPAAFSAWHPSGKVVAFSVNNTRLAHKTVGQSRATVDVTSDLALYQVETNTVISTRAICLPDRRETCPTWSPDGRYLYFVSGAKPWPETIVGNEIIDTFRDVKYDLMRIAYDVETGQWGDLEIVLSGDELGLSLNQPRISPDGRFLIFAGAAYGAFPIYLDTDLYMLDLKSGEYWPLAEANSDRGDSAPRWSTNGRWIVFSSRRRDHELAKLYFAHIDANGRAAKPVLLPQQSPTEYDWRLVVYNVPTFVTGPVQVTQDQLLRGIRSSPTGRQADAVSTATADEDYEPPPAAPYVPSLN